MIQTRLLVLLTAALTALTLTLTPAVAQTDDLDPRLEGLLKRLERSDVDRLFEGWTPPDPVFRVSTNWLPVVDGEGVDSYFKRFLDVYCPVVPGVRFLIRRIDVEKRWIDEDLNWAWRFDFTPDQTDGRTARDACDAANYHKSLAPRREYYTAGFSGDEAILLSSYGGQQTNWARKYYALGLRYGNDEIESVLFDMTQAENNMLMWLVSVFFPGIDPEEIFHLETYSTVLGRWSDGL